MSSQSVRKGILDSYTHQLTPEQRVEYARLRRAGLGDVEARDLAVAVVNATRRVGKSKALSADDAAMAVVKTAYTQAYVDSAKEQLSPWQHGQLHARARARAGGRQSGVTRRAAKDGDKAALLAQRRVHVDAIAAIDAQVQKAVGPLPGQLHVDGLLRGRRKKRGQQLAKADSVSDEVQAMLGAQRLVAGIDYEVQAGRNLADARAIVSDTLSSDPRFYDQTWPVPWLPQPVAGVQLHLASGKERQRGMLGVDTDLAAMDYGTIIFDVRAGLPVAEPSALAALRLGAGCQALSDDQLAALLRQAQVALNYGGRLLWDGPQDLTKRVDLRLLPGLTVAEQDGGRLVLQRERVDVPLAPGADAAVWGRKEETPADLALAYTALAAAEHPKALMANLVHKRDQVPQPAALHAPLVADEPHKQVVWGLIYEPDVVDTQGDYMTAEDIEHSAHQAMRSGIHICLEHDGRPIDASVVESFIAPVDFTMHGRAGAEHVKKGSWLMGVHIADKAVWQDVLGGQYQGFSMGGFISKSARFARGRPAGLISKSAKEADVPEGRRLKNVRVTETSLVKRGANRRNWSVVKSELAQAQSPDEAVAALQRGAERIRPQVVAMVERLSKAVGDDEGLSVHEKVAAQAMANIGAQLDWSAEDWRAFADSMAPAADDDEGEQDEEDVGAEDDEAADYQDDSSYERDAAIVSVGKGDKPLGAAFAHARRVARENGLGKKKEKEIADEYLRRQGHAPMGKAEDAPAADDADNPPQVAPDGKIADHPDENATPAEAAAPALEPSVQKNEETAAESAEAVRKSRDELADKVNQLVQKAAQQDKENEDLRALIKRQHDESLLQKTVAEVKRDFPHIAGTAEEKAGLLMALREQDQLKKHAELVTKSWKAANEQLGSAQPDAAPANLFAIQGRDVTKSARGGAMAQIDQLYAESVAKSGEKRSYQQFFRDHVAAHPELHGNLRAGGL